MELGAQDLDGSPPEATGHYDPKTARILAHWVASDRSRWPDPALLKLAWGHPITDCRVWRALGFDCEAAEIVPGVTPASNLLLRVFGSRVVPCEAIAQLSEPTPSVWLLVVGALAMPLVLPAALSFRRRR